MTLFDRHAVLISRLLKLGFWLACALALARALWPDPYTEPVIGPWDKVVHATAFYVLAVLAMAAYPRISLPRIVLGLAAFGGAIEILQAIPALHRDAAWDDWAADWLGIAIALIPLAARRLGRLRA